MCDAMVVLSVTIGQSSHSIAFQCILLCHRSFYWLVGPKSKQPLLHPYRHLVASYFLQHGVTSVKELETILIIMKLVVICTWCQLRVWVITVVITVSALHHTQQPNRSNSCHSFQKQYSLLRLGERLENILLFSIMLATFTAVLLPNTMIGISCLERSKTATNWSLLLFSFFPSQQIESCHSSQQETLFAISYPRSLQKHFTNSLFGR